MTEANKEPHSIIYRIYFPKPHGRTHAPAKNMIAWGFYDWATETIANTYKVCVVRDKHSRETNCCYLQLSPDHEAPSDFLQKLKRLYNITYYKD